MINTIVDISLIHYEKRQDIALQQSIAKRGVAIAVIVNQRDGYYECVDGNKRLTACANLHKDKIPIMILNNYSKSGSGFWGNTQNHH